MRYDGSIARCASGALLVAAALGVRLLLDPILGTRIPYATFFVAVTLAAVRGGVTAGVVAVLLGGMAAAYFVVPPRGTLLIEGADNQLGFAVYLIVSAILILLTERQRRAISRLAAERERFRVTLTSIGDGVIATDAAGRVTFMNAVAEQATGWSAGEAADKTVAEVFVIQHESTGERAENPVERAISERRVITLTNHTVLLSRDGRRIPVEDSGAPLLDGGGAVIGGVLVFRDVTESKTRQSVLTSQSRMIELAHDAIIAMDAERRIVTWNRGAEDLYGWTAEEAAGRVIHDLLHSRNLLTMREVDEALRAAGRWDGELVHRRKDGREIVAESRQYLMRDEYGAPSGILEINRDISGRKRLEAELRKAAAEAEEGRRLLEAVMEYVPEGLTIADAPDARVRMVSRHGAELSGRSPEALKGTRAGEHPGTWGLFRADSRTAAQPEELPLTRAVVYGEVTTDEEWVIRRPDGQAIRILCNAGPIRDRDGRVTGGVIAWRDITQRIEFEKKLRETAKLESLGVLAGGVAHDFNNLLTAILGNASLLTDLLREGSPEATCADEICAAAERAARLTQQMLAYSGKGRFAVEAIDLSSFIRTMLPLFEAAIPKAIELRLDLSHDLPRIEGDGAQIRQMILNLLINAGEAIGERAGLIVVSTRLRQVDAEYLRAAGAEEKVAAGDYVVLEICDTGCGMDASTIERAFDPFFTTKFTGRGLGLAAVHGIVRGHGGTIRVHSSPGHGATFRVLFPAALSEGA